MTTRTTLPAVSQVAVLTAARPLTTGNLLADCERWCRDHFPSLRRPSSPRRATAGAHTRGNVVSPAGVVG